MSSFGTARLAALLAICAAPAAAAVQGDFADRSQGIVTITATVAKQAQVTGLSEEVPTDGATRPVCVWLNTVTRGYAVTAIGDGRDGAFVLDGDGTHPQTFDVHWTDGNNDAGLRPAMPRSNMVASAKEPGCGASRTGVAALTLAIPPQTASARGGSLSILVTPQ